MLIGKDASKRFLAFNFDFLDISLPLALKAHVHPIGIALVYYCLQALLLFSRAIWLVYQNIPAGMKVLAYSK